MSEAALPEFSVFWWTPWDARSYEECRFVTADVAMGAFKRLTMGPGRRIAARVIITDGGDCIAAEWRQGAGITFPREDGRG